MAPAVAALLLLGSYLLGSLPFGYLIANALYGVDIRRYGSGNIGATNVYRVLGPLPGLIVLLLDVLKGWLPPTLMIQLDLPDSWALLAGLAAIVGHSLSPFLGFRGGKGIATGLGVLIGIAPQAALIGFLTWLLVFGLTRWVSLASITAAFVIPIVGSWLGSPPPLIGLVAAAWVIWRHRDNLRRLLQGKEPRLRWHRNVARLSEACLLLARRAVETYVREDRLLEPEIESLPPALAEPGCVFVSLYLERQLRGCVGTIRPERATLAHEIVHNAVQAASLDPRFPPVQESELPFLHYVVYLLEEPEPVYDARLLNPRKYGVLIEWQGRRGVLLPGIPGIDTVEKQLEIVYAKAGIPKEVPVHTYRFRVKRFGSLPLPDKPFFLLFFS